jgi:hypothetical protein
MLLAELEVFQSRPIAPTRRVALGATVLPTAPSPGFGGLLLGGVVATFITDVDPDLIPELVALTREVEAGRRIAQPRLRHRLQEDRVGLSPFRHRLLGTGEELHFDIDTRGSAAPNVLAAVYAAGRIDAEHRSGVLRAIRRSIQWRGPVGSRLVAHLSDARGTADWALLGGRDPVVWALGVFALTPGSVDRDTVQRRFRELLRSAHPDHGGAVGDAAARIAELSEARRILLSLPGGDR